MKTIENMFVSKYLNIRYFYCSEIRTPDNHNFWKGYDAIHILLYYIFLLFFFNENKHFKESS